MKLYRLCIVFSYIRVWIIRRVSQSSFRFKNTVPIFPVEKTRNDGSGMVMGVLRRTWLTDSVDSMKVYILCVYVQPVLDGIINGVSAVPVFLLRYIHKSEILSARVVFQCDDFFLFLG